MKYPDLKYIATSCTAQPLTQEDINAIVDIMASIIIQRALTKETERNRTIENG